MKFGINLYPFTAFPNLASIMRFTQEAEELGYDFVSIPEHVASRAEHDRPIGEEHWDPVLLATYLASQTRRIRFTSRSAVVTGERSFLVCISKPLWARSLALAPAFLMVLLS